MNLAFVFVHKATPHQHCVRRDRGSSGTASTASSLGQSPSSRMKSESLILPPEEAAAQSCAPTASDAAAPSAGCRAAWVLSMARKSVWSIQRRWWRSSRRKSPALPPAAAGGQLKLIGRGGVAWGVGAGQEADQSSPSPLHEARRRLRASSDCTRPSSSSASWPRGAGRGQTQRPSLQPSPHVAGQEPGLPAARGPGSSPTIVRRHMRSEMRSGLLMKRRFVPQYHTPRPRDRRAWTVVAPLAAF